MADERAGTRDYLAAIEANYPELADHWPGARRRPAPTPPPAAPIPQGIPETEATAEHATGVKAGCIPCSVGHLGVCSALLQEGVRFANSDGIDSDVPIDRIGTCLDELNALERKDLTPELIATLPEWERDLAMRALESSRKIRHLLESIKSLDDLVNAAAVTQIDRKAIGREWFKKKLGTMSDDEKRQLAQEAMDKIAREQSGADS